MKPKIPMILFMLIVSIDLALALGASPANTKFHLKAEQKYYHNSFTVSTSSNLTKVTFRVEGELKDYIQLTLEEIMTGSKELNFTLTVPKKLKPGSHQAKIIISEEGAGIGTVTITPSIHHSVILFVPYGEKYIETELQVIEDNPHYMMFTTIMESKGTQTVDGINQEINLYDNNKKIATIYKAALTMESYDVILGIAIQGTTKEKILGLPRKTFSIKSGTSYENQVAIRKPLFKPGEYKAESIVKYGRKTEKMTKSFRIGAEEIILYPKKALAFADRINKIDLLLGSNWNKPLKDVYVTIDVIKDNQTSSIESKQKDIKPNKNVSAELFWNAEGLELGEYQIKATAHYMDKTFEKDFTIRLQKEPPQYIPQPQYKLYIVSIILLIIIMAVVLMKINKNKDRNNS